jgi:GNAT superfamily N-acetyltransferase
VSPDDIEYRVSPFVSTQDLNDLFAAAWEDHHQRRFGPVLRRSLIYLCAYHGEVLIGFVNVAWDGGKHAFLLDTTVHPDWRLRGIGRELVQRAASETRGRGVEWLHVDFEPHLRPFYDGCGFRQTEAGLLRL